MTASEVDASSTRHPICRHRSVAGQRPCNAPTAVRFQPVGSSFFAGSSSGRGCRSLKPESLVRSQDPQPFLPARLMAGREALNLAVVVRLHRGEPMTAHSSNGQETGLSSRERRVQFPHGPPISRAYPNRQRNNVESVASVRSTRTARTNHAGVDQSAGVTALRTRAVWVRIPSPVPVTEGAAEWPATGLENQGSPRG